MKDKIKNGYFFMYGKNWFMRVGSRCYMLPIGYDDIQLFYMFKQIEDKKIKAIVKPNGERVE